VILAVVATLAIVEKPIETTPDGANEPLLAEDSAPNSSGVVTSGIRKTLGHLRAEAGRLSLFRGFGYYILYSLAEGLLSGLIIGLLHNVIFDAADLLTPILIAIILWTLNNAWLHKVISKPNNKNFIDRIKDQKGRSSVLKAVTLWAFCRSISQYIPMLLARIFLFSKLTMDEDKLRFKEGASQKEFMLEALGIYILGEVLRLLIVAPATIVLVRVQASVLPENDQTIVPCDRTFGGSVVPKDMGGDGILSLLNAWKTFERSALIRLLKTYLKYAVLHILLLSITVAMAIVFMIKFKKGDKVHAF
jgi:hypothetical protein